jgi:hypothetical protein
MSQQLILVLCWLTTKKKVAQKKKRIYKILKIIINDGAIIINGPGKPIFSESGAF